MRREKQGMQPMDGEPPEWSALADYWRGRSLVDNFSQDPQRSRRYQIEVAGLRVDFSRQFIDEDSRPLLLERAGRVGFHAQRDALFGGECVNRSEGRPALHMALRDDSTREWQADGEPVTPSVAHELKQMARFVDALHQGKWRGSTGQPIRHVVNIGIGGSHLGPEMVVTALDPAPEAPRLHFLSNVDPAQAERVLAALDPSQTLFLVVSKTFTSKETMENARLARRWIANALGEAAVEAHFAAVSAAPEQVVKFGIAESNCFRFWDWVGGRYSVWSTAGLAAAVHLGMPAFRELLDGAAEMDRHFERAPDEGNLPLLLGLLDVQSVSAFGWPVWSVVPYADRLRLLPDYFQQLMMESNGKAVRQDGHAVAADCAPVLLGGIGTDAQHAFFQLFHQGPVPVPVDFIAATRPGRSSCQDDADAWRRHRILLANCIAQGEALCRGKSLAEVEAELSAAGLDKSEIARLAPQKCFPGNRPSNLILMRELSPRSLGALIALFEHRVFVQACLWGINPFDQMGVELGKQLARNVESLMFGNGGTADDPAMAEQLAWLQAQWKGE